MNKELMFSSSNYEWETPPEVFAWIDRKWFITIDSCATSKNAKVPRFVSLEKGEDFFSYDFKGETAFMNPPYGRGVIDFVKKAYEEGEKPDTKFVCLLPARTDTRWWHKYVMKAAYIYLVQGRIKFLNEEGERESAAPYPSAVVVFDRQSKRSPNQIPKFRTVRFKYPK